MNAPQPLTGEILPPVNLGGRPSKYRPEFCEAVVSHAQDGCSLTSFAASVGVSRRTLATWAEAHPEFAEAMGVAKACAAAWYEKRLRSVAEGDGGPGAATACVFGLKNLAPDDFQDRQTHEHFGRINHNLLPYEQALEEAQRRGLPARVFEP